MNRFSNTAWYPNVSRRVLEIIPKNGNFSKFVKKVKNGDKFKTPDQF